MLALRGAYGVVDAAEGGRGEAENLELPACAPQAPSAGVAGKNRAAKLPLAISQIDNRQAKPVVYEVMSAEIAAGNFGQIN